MGTRFLTIQEETYRYGKGENWNEPCDVDWNWRYGYEFIIWEEGEI